LINDNPFENSLKSLLTGHDIGLSLGAVLTSPLYIIGTLYLRFFKKNEE
jgi:hypothetical protein